MKSIVVVAVVAAFNFAFAESPAYHVVECKAYKYDAGQVVYQIPAGNKWEQVELKPGDSLDSTGA